MAGKPSKGDAEAGEGCGLHELAGGTAAWRRLAEVFYARVARDPRLRPLFPGKTLHCAIEELTAFLVQLCGGPSSDTQRRWWLSLRESHQRFRIGTEERAAWLENMRAAIGDARIAEPVRGALRELFEQSSAYVVNTGESVSPAQEAEDSEVGRQVVNQMAGCWETQLAVDEVVAAVRQGQIERAIALAETLRVRRQLDRSVSAGLLALMMGNGGAELLRYVRERVAEEPTLLRERYAGRTLLHAASGQGNLAMVEFFLSLGADANARDAGGHTPLYCVANEYGGSDGGDIVRALTGNGANVHANDGVKNCTALHMAARRGHVKIAEALLDCGADIHARDSLGDTPLRRAVNCNRLEIAALMLERGADVHSKGSKSLTPWLAARSSAMKELLRGGASPASPREETGHERRWPVPRRFT